MRFGGAPAAVHRPIHNPDRGSRPDSRPGSRRVPDPIRNDGPFRIAHRGPGDRGPDFRPSYAAVIVNSHRRRFDSDSYAGAGVCSRRNTGTARDVHADATSPHAHPYTHTDTDTDTDHGDAGS